MGLFLNIIRGFCMSLADSVPGVSGGTIAFVLGFYDEFIGSLYSIAAEGLDAKKRALLFLGKLGIGWVIGMSSSVLVLASLFETHIYQLSSLFIGLSIFSLPLIIVEEKKSLKDKYGKLIYAIIGIGIVVLITYFNPAGGKGTNVDVSNLNLSLGAYVFVAAMIAICAMVLPGISGSTLLLIFGLYVPIISAIKEFLHFNFAYFPVLCVFGFGVLAGILSTIKLVKTALTEHRSAMVYFIIGLMIGSIYAIIMGPATLKVPQAPVSWETFSPLSFILGGVILLLLTLLKNYSERKLQLQLKRSE